MIRKLAKMFFVFLVSMTVISLIGSGLRAIGVVNVKEASETVVETTAEATEEETTEAEKETKSDLERSFDVIGRTLTKEFVKGVLQEEYHWLGYYTRKIVEEENGNAIITILYMPGGMSTKVDLIVIKEGNTYNISYAMLNGLYEVDMEKVPDRYKRYVDLK